MTALSAPPRAGIGLALACALVILPAAVPAEEPQARNLLVISLDTLRADHLGAYGYSRDTSPQLDRLAKRGTVFRNAISASAWTVPAHMTAFTGLEPPAHQLVDFPDTGRLGRGYPTLAGILRDAGFRTGAFTGGGFVSRGPGFDRGFERFVSRGRRFGPGLNVAARWLSSLDPDERFFVFLHGFDIHRPYRPPERFERKFAPQGFTGPDAPDIAKQLFPLQEDVAQVHRHFGRDRETVRARPSDADLALMLSQYDGEIAFVDEQIGRFLAGMDERGMLDDTLVVVISDHGDEFWEHGALDHIHTLYDELIRAVWILAGPGVPSAVVEPQVGVIDLLPTVSELLGVSLPAPVQGKSRVALMRGGAPPSETDLDFADPAYSFTGFSEFPYQVASVRTRRWKLIRWSLSGMQEVSGEKLAAAHYSVLFRDDKRDFVELFDLAADPGEQNDLAASHPAVVARLAGALERRIAESAAFARAPGKSTPLSPETREELKALGYIE